MTCTEAQAKDVWKTYRAFAKYPFVQAFPKFEARIQQITKERQAWGSDGMPTGWIKYRIYFSDGVFQVDGDDMEGFSCSFLRKGMSLAEASRVAFVLAHGHEPNSQAPLKPFSLEHLHWGDDGQGTSGWSVDALKAKDDSIEGVEYGHWGQ